MGCFLLISVIIFSLFFSKHVNINTRNNAIVYSHTPATGFGIMFPVNISKKNGVIWCIDVYFEDICLKLFYFLFIEKY